MPRTTREHFDARRRQILEGAARVFGRNGFHATSMQDVLRETGLSAGAVYRYFSGKEEIVVACAQEVLGAVAGAFEEAARAPHPASPETILRTALRRAHDALHSSPYLVIQVWSEALRNPTLGETVRGGMERVFGSWAAIIARYQETGRMRADVPPEHVARTLVACAQGFMFQRALAPPGLDGASGAGGVDGVDGAEEVLVNGLRALISMGAEGAASAPER